MAKKLKRRGVLIYQSGEQASEMVKLRLDGTIFGREKADVVIKDKEVSSTHFQIQKIGDEYHIFDMNSSNGTFLNGQKVVKGKLHEGDSIRVGKTLFQFVLKDETKVRHIPTLFQSGAPTKSHNSIVDTIIDRELSEESSQPIVIEVRYGDGIEEVYTLTESIVYIGRASSFGRFDKDPEISRKHLLIKKNDSDEIFVEDQGSTNGSFINGQKMSGMHRISQADVVQVGLCRLKIYLRG